MIYLHKLIRLIPLRGELLNFRGSPDDNAVPSVSIYPSPPPSEGYKSTLSVSGIVGWCWSIAHFMFQIWTSDMAQSVGKKWVWFFSRWRGWKFIAVLCLRGMILNIFYGMHSGGPWKDEQKVAWFIYFPYHLTLFFYFVFLYAYFKTYFLRNIIHHCLEA